MEKIKIMYIVSHLDNCGPTNILYGIIKNLNFSKFQVYILTLKKEKSTTRIKEFEKLPIEIIINKITISDILLGKIDRIKEMVKLKNITIVHAHCIASTIVASKLKNVLKVTTIHCDFKKDLYLRFGIKGIVYSYIYRYYLQKMTLNISCGKGVKRLNKLHSKLDSIAIMNGIDENKINPQNIKISKNEIRKELKVPVWKKIYITIGSIDKRKNVLFLVDLFSKKLKDKYLFIIGDGEEKKVLEILIKNSDNIRYFGKKNLDEIQYYLKASDYYVSASQSEGVPNSVLEALNFQLPVILSNIEAHKELVEIDNRIGILYENNDKDNFLIKINELEKLEKQNVVFLKIQEKISARRMSKEYMNTYLRLNNEYL